MLLFKMAPDMDKIIDAIYNKNTSGSGEPKFCYLLW